MIKVTNIPLGSYMEIEVGDRIYKIDYECDAILVNKPCDCCGSVKDVNIQTVLCEICEEIIDLDTMARIEIGSREAKNIMQELKKRVSRILCDKCFI